MLLGPMPKAVPISIVCSDLSDNCLGRAEVLAEVLRAFGSVRIVGPQLGRSIWRPALRSSIERQALEISSAFDFARARRWLREQLTGSRVVVSKPRSTSLGLTLGAGVPMDDLLLDIDDWELGFMKPQGPQSWLQRTEFYFSRSVDLMTPRSLNSYFAIRRLDATSRRIPRRTVSNTWLQKRFGGALLPHVRDTDRLDPARFAEAARAHRAQAGLEGRVWVGFIGTIREHKGVEDLVAAVAQLQGSNPPGLVLAGVDFEHAFTKRILETAGQLLPPERLRVVGAFDGEELPLWVAATDVLCVPSRDIPGAWGQIPAKLFDAMALARPIVASRVSDIASILDGCGLVFPAGDVTALRDCIQRLTADHPLASHLAQKARERAIRDYSVASGRGAVGELVEGLTAFGV